MSRLPSIEINDASDASRAVFDKVKKAVGKVPNAYAVIGAYSPASLEFLLQGDAVLGASHLSRTDIEAIRVAVSTFNGCDYCVAAHSMIGKMVGLTGEEVRRLRTGIETGNAKRDVLIHFVRTVANSHGTVAESDVKAVLAAGYDAAQIIEALLVISLITFTNLVNRVNDTEIDFPQPE